MSGYEWLELALTGFVSWLVEQGDQAGIDDLCLLDDALAEDSQGSHQAAYAASCRLAEVAACSPFADVLVPVFDELAEVWMLSGGTAL